MNIEKIGHHKIYRPSPQVEVNFRILAEKNMRDNYQEGKHTDKNIINSILKHQFEFYSRILEEELPKIASRHFIEFVLHQFDQASLIEDAHKNYELSKDESIRWKDLGPNFRRAVKFLAESITILQPDELPNSSDYELEDILDRVWISCEEMVKLYGLSDQTYSVFPDNTVLEILPKGLPEYFSLKIELDIDFVEQVRDDSFNRTKVIGDSKNFYQFNLEDHSEVLGDHFKNHIGINYLDALKLLQLIINNSEPDPNGFPVAFVNKEKLIEIISNQMNYAKETISNVIDGFILTKNKMVAEERKLYKPKQEYRAFRRAFFEFPHHTGYHIAFSKEMAQECLFQLTVNTVFKQFPAEWITPEIQGSLEIISKKNGDWFENFVAEKIKDIGFNGDVSLKRININSQIIKIPDDVGEIDYIGYSRNEDVILILECKFVKPSFENNLFRDDLSDFVNSKKAYKKKFDKKIDWCISNLGLISSYLKHKNIVDESKNPSEVRFALITFYPNISYYFINEYPCVSLTKFIKDYKEIGKWPYNNGKRKIVNSV